jgi:hypothetical protein
MRLARPLALALVGCACFTSAAGAAQPVKLKVAFQPDRAGVRTTIELSLQIEGSGGVPSEPMTSLDLRLPADMGIATSTLGESNCDPTDLLDMGLRGCSANARIGFGEAIVAVPFGSESVHEKASLNALMGPAVEDRLEVLFYVQGSEPVFARLVLPSVVQEDPQSHGEELDTSVPLIQAWPEGPDLSLETFDSTIGPLHLTYFRQIGGKTVPYHPHGIRIPQRCAAGGYPFSALINFQDGTHATAVYHVPCPTR